MLTEAPIDLITERTSATESGTLSCSSLILTSMSVAAPTVGRLHPEREQRVERLAR